MKAPGSLVKVRNKNRLPGAFNRKSLNCGKKKKKFKHLEYSNPPSTLINWTPNTTEIYKFFKPSILAPDTRESKSLCLAEIVGRL